jgi:uncharacterized secreted protein with C-terminal beta-propeller domain
MLISFASEAELLGYFREQVRRARRGQAASLLPGIGLEVGFPARGAPTVGESETAYDSTPYTSTNVQEAGVDEADVFESDGRYFYLARDRELVIIRAAPREQLALLSRLEFDRRIDSLYLFGTKLLVLAQHHGYGYGPGPEIMIWPPYYRGSKLLVAEVDVADPANPTITRQVELDGALAHSRLTNGRLILVLMVLPRLPDDPSPAAADRLTLDNLMPRMLVRGVARELVPWGNWLRPSDPDGYQTTAVVTLDAADIETTVSSVAVLAGAGTVYASPRALYLTDMTFDPDNVVRQVTAIHKLEFGEDGGTRYVASGSVDGRLLNQFSLGEHEGYLRVATHIENARLLSDGGGVGRVAPLPVADTVVAGADDSGGPDVTVLDDPVPVPREAGSENAVFVLETRGSQLQIVGEIRGIARGERLYSARFMGPRGYLVTFIRIDPLFSLDLSDPRNPRITGELKIPGYSDYLHPFGESHLIGVGRSVEITPFGRGIPDALQLSLFDVSDPAAPRLVQQISLGGQGSYSEVSYDHRAFTLLESEGLLAIPAWLNTVTVDGMGWRRPVVLCFRVDVASGFAELGRLEQVFDLHPAMYLPWQRAAFIGQTMYAVSPAGVRAAEVGRFESFSELVLDPLE